MSYKYAYPHMAVTVDIVVFAEFGMATKALLIRRGKPPFEGSWAFPGGFVDMQETIIEAAERELAEETGAKGLALNYLGYFDSIDRDPRERTLSIAFWSIGNAAELNIRAADDASDANWFAINELPSLAFDHQDIMNAAVSELQKVTRENKMRPGSS